MTNTDVAGEGGTTPLPPMPEFRYQAVADGDASPLFDTRDEARAWQMEQRATKPTASLELREVEV